MKNSVGFWKFLSLFSMALLGFLLLREDYPRRLKNKLSPPPPSSSIQYNDYQLNPWFVEQTAFHALFHRHKAIVMLGNSHTFRMQWNELLEREDVANRGIGSDVLGGFLTRLSDVLELSPKVCFIEGGVNDIERDVPIDSSMKYLRSIVDTLRRQVIVPVVIKPIHVAACYPDASGFNHRISVFNKNIDLLL